MNKLKISFQNFNIKKRLNMAHNPIKRSFIIDSKDLIPYFISLYHNPKYLIDIWIYSVYLLVERNRKAVVLDVL